jgi:glycosyltransferase involved in cell wall biosynthesis
MAADDRLRISVDVTWLPRDRRGMGRFVLQVLLRLLERDDVVLTLASRERGDAAALQLLLDGREGWEFASWVQWTRRDRSQVAWFPWNRIDVLPASPRVVTIHDTAAFDWPRPGLGGWLDNRRARKQLRQAVRRATRVMTVSRFSQSCLARHLGVGDADVVIEGESLSSLAATVAESPREKPFVLYVGAHDRRKNLEVLLEAWARLPFRGTELVVAGCRGEPREGVCWLGETHDVTLAGLYRWCDLFVMPSLYEGFGLPLLEAMACGAAVAAARAASLPEVGGDVPAWFDPHDPVALASLIEALLADPARRRRMREAGREQARRFTWERSADQVVACLRKAAGP